VENNILAFGQKGVAARRGGMSKNAFGGHTRLDKLNLQGPSEIDGTLVDVACVSPERHLWCSVIADAVQQYLFYGLGKNGTKRDGTEFWSACKFLFHVRASKPETWMPAKVLRETYKDENLGRRASHVQTLSDEVLKAGCLDAILEHLSFPMTLETFVRRLMAERRNLLQSNWKQVITFLGIPDDAYSMDMLVCPTGPVELATLLYVRDAQMAVAA
jgi:hypothetical protein